MNNSELILEAKKAREMSYAPYSHFRVGAALLTKEGKLYHGCNIENSSYSPTNCAERTAFFKAVSEGEREFEKIAIVGGMEGTDADELCAPCGVCRQVMMEFCDPESFQIILANGKDKHVQVSLKEMVPYGFTPKNAILESQVMGK
jgi:cytidine deaminase